MIFINHISNICIGVLAGLAPVFFLYAVGLLITPTRFIEKFRVSAQPAVYASALIVLCCWYGFRLGISLSSMSRVLTTALLVLLLVRVVALRRIEFARPDIAKQALKFALLYGFFYTIAYVFMMPSGSDEYLPIVRAGNNDILNYANVSRYMQKLGPSNIAGFSFIDSSSMIISFTPAVFDAIVSVSFLSGGETINAIMPTIFGAIALLGCITVWLLIRCFFLPIPIAISTASVVVSGPFMRYIVSTYFLSTLIAAIFVLLIIYKTAEFVIEERRYREGLNFFTFAPYYFLVFYSYPPLLIIGISLQLSLIFLFNIINTQKYKNINILNIGMEMGSWIILILGSVVFIFLVDPDHFISIAKFIMQISAKGNGGWSLNFISPFAIIGLPVSLEVAGAVNQWLMTVSFLVLILSAAWFCRSHSGSTEVIITPIGWAFVTLATLTFVTYFFYFLYIGPSYQQWKMASYLPLFVSFSLFAALFSLILKEAAKKRLNAQLPIFCACVLVVAGNLVLHFYGEPPLEKFSSKYANLRTIDLIGDFKEVSFEMATYSSTFFPVYFVRNKLLHLISPSYYPQEEVKWDFVSPLRPLFIEGDACETKSADLSIDGVGCLYFSAPGLVFERQYSFNADIAGLGNVLGLSAQEAWGRWSDENKVELWIRVDEHAVIDQEVHYINFEVQPFLFSSLTGQNISVAWGNAKNGRTFVSSPGWLSLPFSTNDLKGRESRELHLRFELPDASSPHDLNASLADTRKLGIGFISVSISTNPVGSVLGDYTKTH